MLVDVDDDLDQGAGRYGSGFRDDGGLNGFGDGFCRLHHRHGVDDLGLGGGQTSGGDNGDRFLEEENML